MGSRERYTVPAEELEAVHVPLAEQVEGQAVPRASGPPDGAGPQLHPWADGATGPDADGD